MNSSTTYDEGSPAASKLPRLLVISDVSPEKSVSGQLLLYRLLRDWIPEDLTIVEGDITPSDPIRRLPNVNYQTISYRPPRLNSRLNRFWNTYLLWRIQRWTDDMIRCAKKYRSEAILTVAHGHLWILAAKVARRLHLPLHLIVHDDWPTFTAVGPLFRNGMHRRFRIIYKQAASRLCVSPYMEEEYRRRYGSPGTVLLPSRGDDSPAPRVRVRTNRNDEEGFVLAYAGSIPHLGYLELIRQAAECVAAIGGRLDLYTNLSPDQLAAAGLARPEIRNCGFLPSSELAERIGGTADGLFLPMSFDRQNRATMEVCFPSKLVDYTAIGLPIIIWGPEYCAGIRWGSENSGAAVVVADPRPEVFERALSELARSGDRCKGLAEMAIKTGNCQFSLEAVADLFKVSVRSSTANTSEYLV